MSSQRYLQSVMLHLIRPDDVQAVQDHRVENQRLMDIEIARVRQGYRG